MSSGGPGGPRAPLFSFFLARIALFSGFFFIFVSYLNGGPHWLQCRQKARSRTLCGRAAGHSACTFYTGSAGCYSYSSQRPVCVYPAGGPRVCSLGSVACVLGLVACEVCSQDRCGAIVAKPLCAPLSGRHRARAVRCAVKVGFDRRSSEVWGKGVGSSP